MLNIENVKSGVKKGSEEGIEVIAKDVAQKRGFFKKRSERQIVIFFPKVSVSDVKDISAVYCLDEISHSHASEFKKTLFRRATLLRGLDEDEMIHIIAGPDIPVLLERLEQMPKLLPAYSSTFGYIYVEGIGDDGKKYFAKIYSEKLFSKLAQEEEELRKQQKRASHQKSVEYLMKVGRYEEAARIYEELNMLDKAREMRRKAREATVVSVDLNRLIEQLSKRGFTITYHCSHCGAPLKISGETNAEATRFCSHCGSRIQPVDLVRFIKSHIS